ncbi:MAG: hypothetical protein QOK31_2179 [Solirubrobacteraceae bacterium]|nr:hypothetical protein [Solirubrobacteraceae bacterium]
MPRARGATWARNVYVTAISIAGLTLLGYFAFGDGGRAWAHADTALLVFALCALAGQLVPLKIALRGAETEITTSTAFAFAIVIGYGVAPGALIFAAASFLADLARRKPPTRVVFNSAQYALTVAASGGLLHLLTGVPHSPVTGQFLARDLPGILVAAAVFYGVHTLLVGAVVALAEKTPLWSSVSRDFVFQAATTGLLLGLSPILVITANFSLLALPLLFLPLVAIHRGGHQALLNEHQALHDALTGLPNRVLFRDRIEQAIQLARRQRTTAVAMLMDLDHFKEINDTLGHHQGDRLLQEVAHRLQAAVRSSDTVARLGGDEFGILLPILRDGARAAEVAAKLLEVVRRPFEVDGLTLEIGASVGMAAFPANGNDVTTLIQRADIAMYAAKESDLGYAVYDPDHDRHSTRRLALAGELRTAIENGQLTLHFQPKADLRTGDLVGVEALVRWEHPELGLLGPDEFIPIAERTGSITPLTRYVLEAALSQARAWRDAGVPITVAVNLSARSFLDTQLAGEIPKLLESWDVAPSLLELEITESMIMTDPVRAKGIIDRLSSYGVSLAIDDFGTGYSSLAHLQRLPVNEIKIDKSFIVEMQRDKNAAAIVSSTIELAHSLQMRVVAEGVENAETWNELARLGCDIAQGFYISRPVSAAELQALLESPAAGGPDGADRDGHAVRRRPRVRTRPGAVQTLEA